MRKQSSNPGHDAYFDYALSGIVDTDANGRISRANQAAASITGIDRRRFRGRHLLDLAADDTKAELAAYLELLREQGIGRIETRFQATDGQELVIEMSSVQVAEDRLTHMFDDVTSQRHLMQDLRTATEAAEAANRAKSAFLASISHEIRTPMNGIIGLSRLALMSDPAPEQRELIEQIAQSGRTLLQVINELLDYSKLEAGKTEFEKLPFTLDELLDEVAAVVANTPATEGVELIFHPTVGLPDMLVGDRLRLGQILTNLLGNALKFTTAGTVKLNIQPDKEQDDVLWLRFVVSDTGIGIEAEAVGRLFEPFGQADAATARQYGGTGLGLPIARELARGMGGEIEVKSQYGVGSTFTVLLPFALPAPDKARSAAPGARFILRLEHPAVRAAANDLLLNLGLKASETLGNADLVVIDRQLVPEGPDQSIDDAALLVLGDAGAPSTVLTADDDRKITGLARPITPGRLRRALQQLELLAESEDEVETSDVPDDFVGARVLVAEDNPVNQTVMLGLLRKAGIRTELATDGQQVLDRVGDPGAAPDLILMDVRMPRMDGLEASRLLRARGCRLPIIGASAGASVDEQNACLEAGMNDFLPKPLDADELWGCLTRWLRPSGQAMQDHPSLTAEQRFLDDREALARAREVFVVAHRDDADRLANAIARGDLGAAEHLAHRLKGGALTIGADQIAEIADQLEQSLGASGTSSEAFDGLIARLSAALAPYR